jgi:uncharacterized protein
MKPFSLLVKPASADCNLRCAYCFYLAKADLYPGSRRRRMGGDVLERMISTYMATEQPQYAFGWQGGEPTLMGLEFFQRVTALQQKHGRAGSAVANGLQTNGTLLDEAFARHLAQFRFLVGVSLDGPAEVHDLYRRAAGGAGSHGQVMRGIGHLRSQGVEFNILTLVHAGNASRPAETYRYLRDQGFTHHQYIECVEFDGRGGLLPFAVSGEAWGEFLCGVFDEWIRADARRVSVRLFDSVLWMMVEGQANVCHMGRDCRQYFVVEHNGDVYPCDFYVEPALRLGNVAEATWEELLVSPAYEAFGRRKAEWNGQCEGCAYLRYCAGCCQKNRWGRGSDPRRLSALCEGWKRFYAHALPRFAALAGEVRREREAAARAERLRGSAANRAAPGRNDPCPCGSGRKFKRCCGAAAGGGGGRVFRLDRGRPSASL